MSKTNYFEVTGTLEYFTNDLKDALIKWCEDNHYQYAYIEHNQDLKHDDDTNEDVKVASHIHFLVNSGASRWAFPVLLERFKRNGLLSTMLQKVRRGWNNALSYLIHRTDGAVREGKHLYEPSEVTANFDYEKTIEIIENQVEEKRTRIDEVIENINTLKCRRYNIFEYISIEDYTKKGNKLKIDMAFQYVETRLRQEKKGRDMKVYWIYGKPGIGKSTLAKILCENKKWSFAISSSSNDPLQDYEGQDALILDDFRPAGWSKADVLKMLDNNTTSSIKSRYQNKQTCYLRAIIVTSVQSPYEFWLNGWDRSSLEPYEQLSRRISFEIEMFKDDEGGQFAHTYFKLKTYGFGGLASVETIDFTEQLDAIRANNEKEIEDAGFSSMKRVSLSSDVDGRNIKIDTVKKQVDEKDVPF